MNKDETGEVKVLKHRLPLASLCINLHLLVRLVDYVVPKSSTSANHYHFVVLTHVCLKSI